MLSLLIFLPLICATIVVLAARNNASLSRAIAIVGSLATLVYALFLIAFQFNFTKLLGYQLVENIPWMPFLNVRYHVGLNGLSLLMVVLTIVVSVVALLLSSETISDRVPLFMTLTLVLESALLGVFTSIDLLLFYVFWEAVLIPAYFLIGVYGGDRRIYAALKYVLYTMLGSLVMLVGVIGVYFATGSNSFDIPTLATLSQHLPKDTQMLLLLAFGLAFAIKSALFPFHSWVPDVYSEAATPTTIMLAGILSKMGVYGFLIIAVPFFPTALRTLAEPLALLAVIGIIYGGLLALIQSDAKRLVACSSISHMGIILLGVFSLNPQGLQGAALQMLNHGITTAALFAVLGAIAWRWGTLDLRKLQGLGQRASVLSVVFLVIALSALGLPGLNSFTGEFLILLGAFQSQALYGVAGTVGVILAAWYMLRLYQGIMQGPQIEPDLIPSQGVALTTSEFVALTPLLILIVWIGVAPNVWVHLVSSLSFSNWLLS